MNKQESEAAKGLSSLWNYDKKILDDAAEVTGNFEDANELIELMESEGVETVIEAIQVWADWHGRDPKYTVGDDFNDTVLARLCEEAGRSWNMLQ